MFSFRQKLFFSCCLLLLASFTVASAQTVESKIPEISRQAVMAVKPDMSLPDSENWKLEPAAPILSTPLPVPSLISRNEVKAINPPKTDTNALGHLSIQNAIDLLIQNNLNVVAARFNVDLAHQQKLLAELRPAASVTISATQITLPRIFTNPGALYSTNGSGAANTSYLIEYDRLIERGNKRELRAQQAGLISQGTEAMVKDAIRQQVLQLRQSFLTGVLARENLRVAVESFRTFETSRSVMAVQVKEGYTAGVDLKRVELQKLQYQRDVSTAEQTLLQSMRDIYNLIGVGDSTSIVDDLKNVNYDDASFTPQIDSELSMLDGNLDIEPVLLSVSDLRRLALENRPDVKNAELGLQAAKAGRNLAHAQQQRDITLGGQYVHTGSDNTVGVVATIPLGVKTRAAIAGAQAQVNLKLAESQLRLVQTQALTDRKSVV